MRDVMLVKENISVGYPATHQLLNYCSLVPIKKVQFYLTLCCVSMFKIKLPAICCLKFFPAEKMDFMKHPFLPRKATYSMLKLQKITVQSIPNYFNEDIFYFTFKTWSFFQITKIPFSILNKQAEYFVPKNYNSYFRDWPTATQRIGHTDHNIPARLAEWCPRSWKTPWCTS